MPIEFDQRVSFIRVVEEDFEQLAALRIDAMRESLAQVGRFSPERARERLRKSFYPEYSWSIILDGQRVGFYTFRPIDTGFQLDHLYIHPRFQSKGVGSFVLRNLIAEADVLHREIHLGALKGGRSNQFYMAHGFEKIREDEWDTYYTRRCVVLA